MRQHLTMSERGQVTLPVSFRKRYGLGSGSLLIWENYDGGLGLKPAEAMAVEIYSDEQIAQWIKEDTFKPGERKKFIQKLKKRLQ